MQAHYRNGGRDRQTGKILESSLNQPTNREHRGKRRWAVLQAFREGGMGRAGGIKKKGRTQESSDRPPRVQRCRELIQEAFHGASKKKTMGGSLKSCSGQKGIHSLKKGESLRRKGGLFPSRRRDQNWRGSYKWGNLKNNSRKTGSRRKKNVQTGPCKETAESLKGGEVEVRKQ